MSRCHQSMKGNLNSQTQNNNTTGCLSALLTLDFSLVSPVGRALDTNISWVDLHPGHVPWESSWDRHSCGPCLSTRSCLPRGQSHTWAKKSLWGWLWLCLPRELGSYHSPFVAVIKKEKKNLRAVCSLHQSAFLGKSVTLGQKDLSSSLHRD